MSRGHDEKSRIGSLLGWLITLPAIYALIFTVPFILYGVKYWKAKSLNGQKVEAVADSTTHSIQVQYSTNILAEFIGLIFSKVGVLEWNIASKTILLRKNKGDEAVIFESSFRDIEKFESSINMLNIKLDGKKYTFTPCNAVETSAQVIGGLAAGSQIAAIIIGAAQFNNAGVPELGAALELENVKVVYTQVLGAIEKGYDVGFILAMLLLVWVLFIVYNQPLVS